ncbi:radical SAM protein, partial [Oleiphilus sp. HI0066]|uniref:radical SAM protein n=2 Tax=Oleiphilus TaxID=141450 RepID=UPI0012E7A138
MGIEIDPRSVTVDDIDELVGLGFNRFSFGIQVFNPEVQKAVNREQSIEQIEALVARARALGVSSISFDLIYGLPKQTRASFDETLKEVLRIKPDRLALYNYAHMPDRMPA